MASAPIISWQIDGETMETVTEFILLGSKITADGDGSHEIKRCLVFGRKAMINLQHMKKQRHYFTDKGLYNQSYGSSPYGSNLVVKYGCESWTIKKAEHQRTDAFEQ